MRVLFGGVTLLGLLIGVGIWAYMEAQNASVVSKTNKDLSGPLHQMAGRGEDGKSALESIKLSRGDVGGHLKFLAVDSIVAGGAMENVYGLKPGDQILEMGDLTVDAVDDLDTASAFLLEKYKAGAPLKVRRGGQEIMLAPAHSPLEQLNGIKTPTGP